MLYGIPQTAGKILVGALGVAALSGNANAVVIIAEAVRRAVVTGLDKVGVLSKGTRDKPSFSDHCNFYLRDFMPYQNTPTWKALGFAALKNIIVGTVALYMLKRFCPSTITNANKVLDYVVPIEFTPTSIPLLRHFGR